MVSNLSQQKSMHSTKNMSMQQPKSISSVIYTCIILFYYLFRDSYPFVEYFKLVVKSEKLGS